MRGVQLSSPIQERARVTAEGATPSKLLTSASPAPAVKLRFVLRSEFGKAERQTRQIFDLCEL